MDTPDAPNPRPKARPIRRWRVALNAAAQIVLAVALFLVVNLFSYKHFTRRDLSPSHDYTLSDFTTNYVRKLNKNVDLTVIFTRDSDIMRDARAIVEEYRRVKRNRIGTDEIDPARDLERAEELKLKTGITLNGNGVLVRANDRNRFITEEELFITGAAGDRAHPSIDFRGEEAITSAIIALIEGEPRKFYLISGKGSASGRDLTPDLATFEQLGRRQNIESAALNLTDVQSIPADADGILILAPRYDFSERELAMIRTYWEGKRAGLLVMLDPNGETPRLRGFLAANGIIVRPDRVLYAESTSAGPRKEFAVDGVFLAGSPISKPFTSTSAKLGGQSQSLNLLTDSPDLRAQHIEVTPLLDASQRYWGETRYLDQLPFIDAQDTQPPVHLAASVERGYVADERLRVESSRMVAMANASMLDPSTRLAVDQDFLSSCLNWMINRERLVGGITPKRKEMFRLQLTDAQRGRIFKVTAILLPGAALCLGLLVWSHRRA